MGAKQKRKTPSKTGESEESFAELFSPVTFVSPARQHPSQGNLTGSERKLKDGAADLNNYIEKWGTLNTDGANIISDMANIKLEKLDEASTEDDVFPDTLLPLCEQMDKLITKMEKVLTRLTGLVEMSKGVAELEKYNQSDASSLVLFQTWDVDRFASVFEEIVEMYRKEMALKRCIVESICHATNRDGVMFYSAAWIHQPYIDNKRATLLLESLLLETRHKS